MAFLNVRERRVETTIAYIGPFGAGKATNLLQLGRHVGARGVEAERAATDELGETITLDWQPSAELQFRDCGLSVRVVASQGSPSVDCTRALLRSADGVVLVLDAHPSASEANRASVELVREAMDSDGRCKLPVLVQVNKVDLAGARDAAELASEFGAGWPHVVATAKSGDGVVETLERALRDVLENLERTGSDPERETVRPPPGAASSRTEGNPLLTALRQVLRETVGEHVAELERRFVAQTLAAIEERFVAATVAAVEERLAAIGADREKLPEIGARLEQSGESTRCELVELRSELARLTVATREISEHVERMREASARSKEQLKVELLAGLDARSRSDRDLAAASLLPLRKSIEQLGAELKGLALRDGLVEIARDLGALRGQVEPIGKLANGVRDLTESFTREAAARRSQLEPVVGIVPTLSALEGTVRRELVETISAKFANVEASLVEQAADTQEAHARSEENVAELRNQLTELIDELKKRAKKGWFG